MARIRFRGRCVLPEGERLADVVVDGHRIAEITDVDGGASPAPETDDVLVLAPDEVLMPGLVDTHVHVNEPGRTEWEGFASATRAAAAGGVTTIVDMPLNSIPPTVDVEALAIKQAATDGQRYVDIGFWGGAVPVSLGSLKPLHDKGVYGFKCFTLHSGVDEFPPLDRDQLEAAMVEVAGFGGLLIVHAEDAAVIDRAPGCSGPSYADFVHSRPPEAEDAAIATVLDLAADHGTRVHLLHLSNAGSLDRLAQARADGVRVTVETCPHYLTLEAETVADGATAYKCCPPIRDHTNQARLWQGLRDGVIDIVVSDHSPSTPELKRLETGDFGEAWGGIASVQLGLPLIWTAAGTRGHNLVDVARWMSQKPADIAGISSKGGIVTGKDADLVVFAPDDSFVVDPTRLHHKNPLTPYAGATLRGVVRQTWLRGRQIATGSTVSPEPAGALLTQTRCTMTGVSQTSSPVPLPAFTQLPDLASRALAGSVIAANDELFAQRENLIKPEPSVFAPHEFGHKGKVYDGWETRRRRDEGHDWAMVRLGVPGVVHGVVVDTAWFTGNYPPFVSVEALHVDGYPPARRASRP